MREFIEINTVMSRESEKCKNIGRKFENAARKWRDCCEKVARITRDSVKNVES